MWQQTFWSLQQTRISKDGQTDAARCVSATKTQLFCIQTFNIFITSSLTPSTFAVVGFAVSSSKSDCAAAAEGGRARILPSSCSRMAAAAAVRGGGSSGFTKSRTCNYGLRNGSSLSLSSHSGLVTSAAACIKAWRPCSRKEEGEQTTN
jgi:hypothetical protein